MIDGRPLIKWGLSPGPHFKTALNAAQKAEAAGGDPKAAALAHVPQQFALGEAHAIAHGRFIEATDDVEAANVAAVDATVAELSRTPMLTATAVIPDACPTGALGTIPVGGVAASKAIHPWMHSADICCSVTISVLGDVDPKATFDRAFEVTHFGPVDLAEDARVAPPAPVLATFENNPFLKGLETAAVQHFAT